jgi:hypothetical protein
MEVYSGLTLSDDGVVTGCWSECSSSLLLRKIRLSAPGDRLGDIFVIARLAFDVLSDHPGYKSVPVFSGSTRRTSLCLELMSIARGADWDAIERASDDDVIAATNIARWILQLPQQTSSPIVFVDGPGAVPSPRRQAKARVAS